MPFSEETKLNVKRKSHFKCCLCHALGIEIHHIVPQGEDGYDTEDNAAPLCPNCHETYGANLLKRKFIREARNFWYELCEKRYASDPEYLNELKRLLENIEAHVQSSNYPLLPFALFYTLRHTTTPDVIERSFKNASGYKLIKNDFLKIVSIERIGGHGIYNSIDFSPTKSHCTLDKQSLEAMIERHTGFCESAIKSPTHTTIEFFFQGSSSEQNKPSVVLKKAFGDGKPREVKHLELFDDQIFQDVLARGWEITNPSKKAWGIGDLRGARIRLTIEISSYSDLNLQYPPRLHNLHMYFGTNTPHILFFSAKQLEEPIVEEDTNLAIRWDFSAVPEFAFRPLLVKYEFQMDEEMFCNQLMQIS